VDRYSLDVFVEHLEFERPWVGIVNGDLLSIEDAIGISIYQLVVETVGVPVLRT